MTFDLRWMLFGLVLVASGGAGTRAGEDSQSPSAPLPCGRCVEPWGQCECRCAGWNLDPSLRRLGPCAGACDSSWAVGRVWVRAEYLAWDTQGYDLPALVTTGSATTPAADAGQLDQADTAVLFGSSAVHNEFRSGGRLTIGSWCTPAQLAGVELSYFGIDGHGLDFYADSAHYPVLGRPFVDAASGDQERLLVAYPGLLEGSTSVRANFELSGAEALFRRALHWTPTTRVDLLAGYRYGRLHDTLQVSATSFALDAASGYPVDAVIERFDRFRVVNHFHGGQLGLASRCWWHCWSLSALAKVAFGGVQSRSRIAGDTAISELVDDQWVTTDYEGGLLALPTNSGQETFYDAAVMAEIGVNLEYQIRYDMRIAFGYTFLAWSDVVRMESILQTQINPTQIAPGTLSGDPLPAAPAFEQNSFWAQGLNLSFEYAF